MRKTCSRHQFGVTLVEICIATAIAAILFAVALPSFKQLLQRRALEGVASQLATDLRYLRSEAVARNRSLQIGFGIDGAGNCYVLYGADDGECTCHPTAATVCTGAAHEIKTVAFPPASGLALRSNVPAMLFDPVHGTTTPGGTVRLLHADGAAIHHIVNITGRVRTCSPSGVRGYRSC